MKIGCYSRMSKKEEQTLPKLNVKRKCDNITDFTFEDMEIIGYHPYPNISVEMVV